MEFEGADTVAGRRRSLLGGKVLRGARWSLRCLLPGSSFGAEAQEIFEFGLEPAAQGLRAEARSRVRRVRDAFPAHCKGYVVGWDDRRAMAEWAYLYVVQQSSRAPFVTAAFVPVGRLGGCGLGARGAPERRVTGRFPLASALRAAAGLRQTRHEQIGPIPDARLRKRSVSTTELKRVSGIAERYTIIPAQ